ncbi:Na(+)/citrate cotransporter-like [Babylonia areolata]|uniref:Na(+)/citrate cotransporter-like n=1 Tax=Babylonia areolata TaxID=304850 RepID=UPI003FD1666D
MEGQSLQEQGHARKEQPAAVTLTSWTPAVDRRPTQPAHSDSHTDTDPPPPPPNSPPSQNHTRPTSSSGLSADSTNTEGQPHGSPTGAQEAEDLSVRLPAGQSSPSATGAAHGDTTKKDTTGPAPGHDPCPCENRAMNGSPSTSLLVGLCADTAKEGTDIGEEVGMVPLSREITLEVQHHQQQQPTRPHHARETRDLSCVASGDHEVHEGDKGSPMLLSDCSSNPRPGGENQGQEVEVGVEKGRSVTAVRQLLSMWYMAVIFLVPIVLLPLPLVVGTPEAKCAYVIFVMAVFWMTEAIPIPVTSLMPIFLLPMMGLLTARQTSSAYINDTSILFMGGLMVAIAIEKWNLHKRIALAVILVVGSEPRRLMLGMMCVTWVLSMWISNTATTAMMLPIAQAVLQHLSAAARPSHPHQHSTPTLQHDPSTDDSVDEESPDKHSGATVDSGQSGETQQSTAEGGGGERAKSPLSKALSLAIAYSANVGGVACLTGTGPNLVLVGQAQIVFEKVGLSSPITFANWMVYGLPLSFLLLILVWIWLNVLYLRPSCARGARQKTRSRAKDANRKIRDVIRAEFRKLGPVTYAEGTILVCFAVLVALWITRDLGGAGGWGSIFPSRHVSDSTPAILIGVLMFVLPSRLPDIFFRMRRQGLKPRAAVTALLSWDAVHTKMPWSLFLLLGGGFALARAAQESGLSLWLGQKLAVFGALDPWLMLLIVCYIVTFVTEVTSNTAIATIMMPILAQLSVTLELNPLFFMFPAALTSSFAFMLPVATPPNAIVFAYGALRVIDMVMCGIMLNIVSVPVLLLATSTWGNAFFHFDVMPPQFSTNVTGLLNTTAV